MNDDATIIPLPTAEAVSRERHPTSATDDVASLRRIIAQLDEQRIELAEDGDYEALVRGAVLLDPLVKDLATLLRSTKQDAGAIISDEHVGRGKPRVQVPGVGLIEVDTGSSRRGWDSQRLLRTLVNRVLIDRHVIDEETGEVIDHDALDLAGTITALIEDCLGMTASTSWRIGGLREHHVDPDEWSEYVAGTPTARIPKPNPRKEQPHD